MHAPHAHKFCIIFNLCSIFILCVRSSYFRYIMALVLKNIFQLMENLLHSRDARVFEVPFTSPVALLLINCGYLYFIRWGIELMRHRKPLNLRSLILAYNIVQVVLNMWIAADVSVLLFFFKYLYTKIRIPRSRSINWPRIQERTTGNVNG